MTQRERLPEARIAEDEVAVTEAHGTHYPQQQETFYASTSTDRPPDTHTRGPDDRPIVKRINVNFSEDAYTTLQLLTRWRATTLSEILRQAISVLYWFEQTRREGGRILVERDGQTREVIGL